MGPLGRQVPGLERRRSERVGVTAHEHRDHHFGLDAQALLERVTDAALRAIPAWTASRATATAKYTFIHTGDETIGSAVLDGAGVDWDAEGAIERLARVSWRTISTPVPQTFCARADPFC